MRVVFSSLPATGHFNSIVPLAQAVAAAGHEIAICSSPAFAAEVAALGARHFPGGARSLAEISGDAPARSDPGRGRFMQVEVFGRRAPEKLIPVLTEAIEDWRPDLLVRESSEYASCLVAEAAGLPHASVATGSWSARLDRRDVFAEVLSAGRIRLGLAADPDAAMMSRYLQLAFMPPRWDGDAAIPQTTHFIRYENPDRPGQTSPAWLVRESAHPLVLASLGTLMHDVPGLLEAIIAALGDEPIDVVAAIGRETDPARFGKPPRNVRLEPYVPQIPLLAECAAFVTHGGFNSAKEALCLGVPLVVIPIGGDQFYTAERCAALGVGRVVPPPDRDPAHIRRALQDVLADPRYRESSQAVAAEMRTLPPIGDAVRLLARLAAERRPILRR